MVQEIEINTVPDELYNLTQLAEVTLAAGKLSTTNINQIKNYIQQKSNYDNHTFKITQSYHDIENTTTASANNNIENIYQVRPIYLTQPYRDDIQKLTDLDEYKINLTNNQIKSSSSTQFGNWKNYWMENSMENILCNNNKSVITSQHNNTLNLQPQQKHSVIKYEKKYLYLNNEQSDLQHHQFTDLTKNVQQYNSHSNNSNFSDNSIGSNELDKEKININYIQTLPSSVSTSPSSTSSSSSYEKETKNYIYSHKIFDLKKSRHFIQGELDPRNNIKTVNNTDEFLLQTGVVSLSQSSSNSSIDSVSIVHINGDDKIINCSVIGQGEESHICPECGKKYSTSSNLARHRQTHRSLQDKKARKCEFCEKVYVSMPAYSMHVRTHNQGCKCIHCGKCFSRPWLLQGHIRTHTGEKPFKCSICPKAFADKSNLRAHIQTHSNTKPHSCSRCGKAFALKSYLYKHEESSCMKNHYRHENSSKMSNISSNSINRKIKKTHKNVLLQLSSDEQDDQHESNRKSDANSFDDENDVNDLIHKKRLREVINYKEHNFSRTSVIRKTVIAKTISSNNNNTFNFSSLNSFEKNKNNINEHEIINNNHKLTEINNSNRLQDIVIGYPVIA